MSKERMYCFQCQEANKNVACTIVGVCGKKASLAKKMDIVKEVIKSIGVVREVADLKGIDVKQADEYIISTLFKLITNANFDEEVFEREIKTGLKIREELKAKVDNVQVSNIDDWVNLTVDQIVQNASNVGTLLEENENIRSMKEFVYTGLMGMAAYIEHARHLGYENKEINDFIAKALAFLVKEHSLEQYIKLVDEIGSYGFKAMEMLDEAHTNTYDHPRISTINIGVGKKPGILISGHDLKDIELLLKQSENEGIDIYTHSEMLPAHFYPKLQKYEHLYGNYGSAWYNQVQEFEQFNGPILFTTNCIVPPRENSNYINKVYTTGNTGFSGFRHIEEDEVGNKDFSEIIEQAKKCKAPNEIESGKIIGGFAHNQVGELLPNILDLINSGHIKKFVVMAGCDGRHKERTYYTDYAKGLPEDFVILTAGCAKYKYNKLDLGDIKGVPRVLDAGQCNDSYSLIKIALLLKDELGVSSVNDLPLIYNIAWYEQKAVIVLLTLLHLNIKNIKLGPTLPAFLTEDVAKYLVDTYNISTISTVDEDLQNVSMQ